MLLSKGSPVENSSSFCPKGWGGGLDSLYQNMKSSQKLGEYLGLLLMTTQQKPSPPVPKNEQDRIKSMLTCAHPVDGQQWWRWGRLARVWAAVIERRVWHPGRMGNSFIFLPTLHPSIPLLSQLSGPERGRQKWLNCRRWVSLPAVGLWNEWLLLESG